MEDEPRIDFSAFDRYVEEHGIPEEHYPAAFALWYAEAIGEPVSRFERVPPGQEQILPDREQRELDSLPSMLALRKQTSRFKL